MTFSFVIPTFRRPEALAQTLTAIAAIDYESSRWEVIVVDDGSPENIDEVVSTALPAARLITQQNAGAAAARNRGAACARYQMLVFLDDDMIVAPDHLHHHEAVHLKYDPCLVNGRWEFERLLLAQLRQTPFGRYRLEVEQWVKDRLPMDDLGDGRRSPQAVTACNLSVARETFLALGGFDESFGAAGAEDQEFSVRARQAGLRFVYAPEIRLLHNDGRITFRQFCQRQRQGAQSARLLAAKHPAEFSRTELVKENGRVKADDSLRIRVKKVVKRVASTAPALRIIHVALDAIERAQPGGRLLRRAYWATTGLYIFRGVLDQE